MLNWKQAEEQRQQKAKDSIPEAHKKLILLVDDEDANLQQLKMMLESQYRILIAQSGAEALEKISESGIAIIVSDQRMPGMTGTEFFTEAEKRQHPAPRIILTGFADLPSVIESINSGSVYRYLTKPVNEEQLFTALQQAMEHFEVNQVNLNLMAMLKDLMEDNTQMAKQLNRPAFTQKQGSAKLQEPRKLKLAILTTDIRNFTQISAKLDAVQVIELLQTVHSFTHAMILEHNGRIDKHMGDGLMAFFGLGGENSLASATNAMKAIVEGFSKVSKEIERKFGFSVRLGIGMAGGSVTMGMLGSKAHNELAIIGRTVNLAHRLQEVTKLLMQNTELVNKLGGCQFALGCSLPQFVRNATDYNELELPSDILVRNFKKIRTLSVIVR